MAQLDRVLLDLLLLKSTLAPKKMEDIDSQIDFPQLSELLAKVGH